jgi:hypothetical protein
MVTGFSSAEVLEILVSLDGHSPDSPSDSA